MQQQGVTSNATVAKTVKFYSECNVLAFWSAPYLSRSWCLLEIAVCFALGKIHEFILVGFKSDGDLLEALKSFDNVYENMQAYLEADKTLIRKYILSLFGSSAMFNIYIALVFIIFH